MLGLYDFIYCPDCNNDLYHCTCTKEDNVHTPGPWKCEWNDEDIANIEGTYKVYPIPRGPTFGGLRDQYQANAQLIEAAPDLKILGIRTVSFLNALPGQNADKQYFSDWFRGAMKFRDEWERTLAKIEGG